MSRAEDSLFWSEADVVQATDNFNQNHKISEGAFADIYKGQRHGTPFVFKKLREASTSWFLVRSGSWMGEAGFSCFIVFSHRWPTQVQDQLKSSSRRRYKFVIGKPPLWKILCSITMTANLYVVLPVCQACLCSLCKHFHSILTRNLSRSSCYQHYVAHGQIEAQKR